jgi:hypothetical protein
MRTLTVIVALALAVPILAAEPSVLLAQAEPTKPVDMKQAPTRVMGLYEQGFLEGHKSGNMHSGKAGWFFIGFGNVPLLWLPWVVEPSYNPKPPIVAEEEFNSGYRHGYLKGWKNAHKNYYIAGTLVSSAIAAGIIIASQ